MRHWTVLPTAHMPASPKFVCGGQNSERSAAAGWALVLGEVSLGHLPNQMLGLPRCRDPARERVMKEASRKLKNVKLQYTDPQEAIFFEDVAGIGDAKVRYPILL